MSYDSEDWKDYKSDQKDRRSKRLPANQEEIENLSKQYVVKILTNYHYRINGFLDLYPTHKRFHNIKTNKRGNYKSALEICKQQFKIKL